MTDGSPRILVIKLRYLGDVLLTTPVFDALRSRFPDAFIAAVVNKGTEDMLTENPAIDRIFTVIRDFRPLADLRKQFQLIREIRAAHFDVVLELTHNDRAAVLAFLSGAGKRLGYKPKKRKRFRRSLLLTDLVPVGKKLHVIDRHLELAKAMGCSVLPSKPTLYWTPQDQRSCGEILTSSGVPGKAPYVVLHPSSAATHKVWTAEGYAELCDYLSGRKSLRTILICGKDKEELRLNREICALSESPPLDLGGRLSLKQTAALLSEALLFIGIDSGPMHMAAAVGTPVVAIFGPSRPWRWGPRGAGQVIIQKKWDCVPCGKKGCRDDGGESRCLMELTPDEVLLAVENRLDEIFRTPAPAFPAEKEVP
ncbi:putative lipopolysaccharide heptosyltransferase III [Syntrophus buswellii]|uniref:putative lipopolysaccharide heptosyltransferase III n=1 Tax=Syntrophus buswellii TaxID=43774 RepID=UPI0038D47EAD